MCSVSSLSPRCTIFLFSTSIKTLSCVLSASINLFCNKTKLVNIIKNILLLTIKKYYHLKIIFLLNFTYLSNFILETAIDII